jgi:hypothetical protein
MKPTRPELLAENRALKKLTARLQERLAEAEGTLDLIRRADLRAIKRWQEEKPGRELIWPDRTELILWLLRQLPEKSERGDVK